MEKKETQTFLDKYLTPIAVIAAALIIVGAFAFGNADNRPSGAGDDLSAISINDVKRDTGPSIGDPAAPVTIAVWYDFQCRFCKQFETTTLAQVQENYVEEGTVRILYKDFQFLGLASNDAALYSRAVWEAYPNRWHEWFAGMFEQEGEGAPDLAGMNAISTSLGLDAVRIENLLDANRNAYQDAIDADRAEGVSFGINGTPGTIIGDQLIAGAQPYAVVMAALDAELE